MTGGGGWISKTRRAALVIRGGFCCVRCSRDLRTAKPYEITLDHLEDLVDGGGHKGANHASTNLVLCCNRCNSSRGNRSYVEFYGQVDGALERVEAQRNAFVNLELAKSLLG